VDRSIFPFNLSAINQGSQAHLSTTQQTNAQLFARVCQVESALQVHRLRKQLPKLTHEALSSVSRCWQVLRNLQNELLAVLVNSVWLSFQSILMMLHEQDSVALTSEGSECLIQLQARALYLHKHLLPLYQSSGAVDLERQQMINAHLDNLCARVVSYTVRVCCVLPSLSSSAKLRLANDLAQLEAVLYSILPKTKAQAFQDVSHFKEMLFAEHDRLVEMCEKQVLPRVLCLQFLLSSCGVPHSAPHRVLGMKLDEYLRWMDEHKESEAYELLSKAYQRIENKINIPQGPDGRDFIATNYPRLALALTLMPRPT